MQYNLVKCVETIEHSVIQRQIKDKIKNREKCLKSDKAAFMFQGFITNLSHNSCDVCFIPNM